MTGEGAAPEVDTEARNGEGATGLTEERFEQHLEAFHEEVETAARCLYAMLAIDHFAGRDAALLDKLNEAPAFWIVARSALLTTTFIALGRIFDQTSPYNLDKLVKIARDNPAIFSPGRLADRKRHDSPSADEWLPDYLKSVYVPTPKDFRRLGKAIDRYRRKYQDAYGPIRNKVYAHKELVRVEAQSLFARTSAAELQRIVRFLQRLHRGLDDLYLNGRTRTGRRPPLTIETITRRLDDGDRGGTAQEIIVGAVRSVMADLRGGSSRR